MNHSQQRPLARKEGLVIQEMPNEVLVFDMETNKAHCLNETAAFVWKACNGASSVAEITRSFSSQSGKVVDENLVWLAIDQLNKNDLLAENLQIDFKGQTRRELIKKIGLGAVIALPIVSSLVAPTAAMAVTCSGVTQGGACSGGACCNGVCCAGVTAGTAAVCTGSGGSCPPPPPASDDVPASDNTP